MAHLYSFDFTLKYEQLGIENSQIHFTETFNVFRLLKSCSTILEGSNMLELYSVEVCFYQTCERVTLDENKGKNDRFKNIVFAVF